MLNQQNYDFDIFSNPRASHPPRLAHQQPSARI